MDLYRNPVRTLLGEGALGHLPQIVQEALPEGRRALLLVWHASLAESPAFRSLSEALGDRLIVECFPHGNPTLEQVYTVWEGTRNHNIGLVIAVGGGSTLDVGKTLCCLYGREIPGVDALRTLITEKRWGTPACRWVGIPTTAGTGSEVTCWATVWDPERGSKLSVDTPENFALAAVVDPVLTQSMPLPLSVSSALDAVAHAVESHWAKASNAVSRALAQAAIRRIMGAIEGLFSEAPSTRSLLSEGCLLAGLAFSNTRTTACHSISYPLTLRYRIPHGVAVALLLAPVMRLNASACDLSEILAAFGADTPDDVERRVKALLQRAGFATTLREWGASQEDLPELAHHSITKGRADNNPAEITEATAADILRQIF